MHQQLWGYICGTKHPHVEWYRLWTAFAYRERKPKEVIQKMVGNFRVILTKEPKTGGNQCGCFQILKVILGKAARVALRAAQSRASLYTAQD